MSPIPPVAPPGAHAAGPLLNHLGPLGMPSGPAAPGAAPVSFQSVLSAGLDSVNRKVAAADELVRQFAIDDSVPVHRVTIALEEARLAMELALQVRSRLVETYRELMTMQL